MFKKLIPLTLTALVGLTSTGATGQKIEENIRSPNHFHQTTTENEIYWNGLEMELAYQDSLKKVETEIGTLLCKN